MNVLLLALHFRSDPDCSAKAAKRARMRSGSQRHQERARRTPLLQRVAPLFPEAVRGNHERCMSIAPHATYETTTTTPFTTTVAGEATGVQPRFRGKNHGPLPLCNVTCGAVLRHGFFRRRGPHEWHAPHYDHSCFVLKASYHWSPTCASKVPPIFRPDFYSWTLIDAQHGRCALPTFDPAEAVRTWRQRTPRKLWQPIVRDATSEGSAVAATAVAKMTTVLFVGDSFLRQVFEAIVCRWRHRITGGFVTVGFENNPGAPKRAACLERIVRSNGTCHGYFKKQYARMYNGDYRASLVQHAPYCSDAVSCFEFGPTARFCFIYCFATLREHIKLVAEHGPRGPNGEVGGVDILVTTNNANLCSIGGAGGLGADRSAQRLMYDALETALPEHNLPRRIVLENLRSSTMKEQLTRDMRSHSIASGKHRAMADYIEGRHFLGARSEGNCADPDQHFAMPGLPDAEATRTLAMIATGDTDPFAESLEWQLNFGVGTVAEEWWSASRSENTTTSSLSSYSTSSSSSSSSSSSGSAMILDEAGTVSDASPAEERKEMDPRRRRLTSQSEQRRPPEDCGAHLRHVIDESKRHHKRRGKEHFQNEFYPARQVGRALWTIDYSDDAKTSTNRFEKSMLWHIFEVTSSVSAAARAAISSALIEPLQDSWSAFYVFSQCPVYYVLG